MTELNLLFTLIAQLLVLSVIIEGVTDLFKSGLKRFPTVSLKIPSQLISLSLGIAIAFGLHTDATTVLGQAPSIMGMLLTGALASRSSNYLNGLAENYLGQQKK